VVNWEVKGNNLLIRVGHEAFKDRGPIVVYKSRRASAKLCRGAGGLSVGDKHHFSQCCDFDLSFIPSSPFCQLGSKSIVRCRYGGDPGE
jgi:hypothetical protein